MSRNVSVSLYYERSEVAAIAEMCKTIFSNMHRMYKEETINCDEMTRMLDDAIDDCMEAIE